MNYHNKAFYMISSCGGMADALDSGSSGSDTVWVQVPSTAGVIEKTGREDLSFLLCRGA